MNPLLSFWIKVQPLSGSLGTNTWKAISQTSAIAPSSGDDTVVQRTTSSSHWAFDYFISTASRLASQVYISSSSWLLNPMISRMHDAPIFKPSSLSSSSNNNNVAICEAGQRYTPQRVGRGVNAKSFTTTSSSPDASPSTANTPLLKSQQLLQQQDYLNYQIPIQPIRRRNSKDWVREYKKERIDKINFNNVFGGLSSVEGGDNEIPTLPPPPASEEENTSAYGSNEKYNIIHPPSPTLSSSTVADSVTSLPSLSPPTTIHNKQKTTHLNNDHTIISTPTPVDVICGRGGKANTHPGNISFRDEAKKLRSWYESSSKSEKFTISSFLVDVVRERGGRFLKRDANTGGWLECDGNDVRKKASQALREGRQQRGQQQ